MKTFKDHHLYLGCHAMVSRPSGRQAEKITPAMIEHLHTLGQSWDLYKPILRPLSSMTEEENKRWKAKMHKQYSGGAGHTGYLENPESFRYLLSIGIDLFGLIDSGLAVTAETLK